METVTSEPDIVEGRDINALLEPNSKRVSQNTAHLIKPKKLRTKFSKRSSQAFGTFSSCSPLRSEKGFAIGS